MLGEYLKSHREKLNLTINDIASVTKVSPKYLLAIEQENFKSLPGELFVRSFIKEYAKAVSLSPEEALRLYEETVKPIVPVPDVIPVKTESSNKSVFYIVGALIVLAIVIFMVYTFPKSENIAQNKKSEMPSDEKIVTQKPVVPDVKSDKPETQEAAQPQSPDSKTLKSSKSKSSESETVKSSQPQSKDSKTLKSSKSQTQESETLKTPQPQSSDTKTLKSSKSQSPESETLKTSQPQSSDTKTLKSSKSQSPESKKPETFKAAKSDSSLTEKESENSIVSDSKNVKDKNIKGSPKDKTKETNSIDAGNKHELKIDAQADTWILVKIDKDRNHDMILKAGESKTWSANSQIIVKTGNAGGINITFDGKDYGVLGKKGEVKTITLPEKEVKE
ncbi:MAG: helix-turn-helix domain-containing protein [Nitrospirae bacterium]|nr:helix-turn-helix domain-containing protein [Nitrospirota bacterium]